MKKLLALALAVVMMMAIALPVFAANGAESTSTWGDTDVASAADQQSDFDQVVLEYGVYQAYEVTIPADINFGYMDGDTTKNTLSDERNVAVTNAVIAGTETLVITVVSENGWNMADTFNKSTAVDYTATVGSRPAFSKTYDNDTDTSTDPIYTVLTVGAATGNIGTDPNNDADVDIVFTTAGTAQEGLYRDTLTFTVTIVENYTPTFTAEHAA